MYILYIYIYMDVYVPTCCVSSHLLQPGISQRLSALQETASEYFRTRNGFKVLKQDFLDRFGVILPTSSNKC